MKESVAPIMRITDVDRAVEWYQRLGFGKAGEHRFEPDMPAYVFIARGDVWLHLSQHEGDARQGTLVYLLVEDVDAIANDFRRRGRGQPLGSRHRAARSRRQPPSHRVAQTRFAGGGQDLGRCGCTRASGAVATA